MPLLFTDDTKHVSSHRGSSLENSELRPISGRSEKKFDSYARHRPALAPALSGQARG
jgi:hypothetical protein